MCPSQFQSKYVCFSGFTVQNFAMQSQYFIPRLCKQMSDGLLGEFGRHVWSSKKIEGEIHSKIIFVLTLGPMSSRFTII